MGLAFVLLWFGLSQLVSPDAWLGYVPAWATGSGLTANTLVHMNGAIEIVGAVLLAFGLFVRWVGILLGIHLALIAALVGMNAVGVRDIGLALALIGIGIAGVDAYGLGHRSGT